MKNTQLEILVHYQDIDLMLQESEEIGKTLGFHMEGHEKLQNAKIDLETQISPKYLNTYKRLSTRYKRPIVPVQNDTCLGCFSKLPTYYTVRAREDQQMYTCENCGRILYWMS